MTPALAFYLDSIGDHVEALHALLTTPGIDPELVSRLRTHILMEERRTTSELEALGPGEDPYLLQLAKDHSFFLQKMLGDGGVPQPLMIELLHHFAEEHEHLKPKQESKPPPTSGRQWTVGPLRPPQGSR
ncbi:MAG: hypothetical protein AB2A00_11445 [Myxococcota bacterium]